MMMQELTFGQVKDMNYPSGMPFGAVLMDLLFKKMIDVNAVLSAYTEAIEKENHINKMRFEEACGNLCQILSGNFTTEEQKSTMMKHAIHTYNMSNSLATHLFDEQYGSTEDDKAKWDEHCNTVYGHGINK